MSRKVTDLIIIFTIIYIEDNLYSEVEYIAATNNIFCVSHFSLRVFLFLLKGSPLRVLTTDPPKDHLIKVIIR